MNVKHSLSIMGCNLSLIYKLLIFISVVLLIVAALLVSIINPVIRIINEELQIQGIIFNSRSLMENPFETLSGLWQTAKGYFAQNASQFALRLFYLFCVFVLVRFCLSLVSLPVSKIIHERMTSGSRLNLFPEFISLLPKSVPFALLSALIYSVLDFLIMLFSVWLVFAVYKALKIFSIVFVFALFLFLISARTCIFSHWQPEILNGARNPLEALCKGFKSGAKTFFKNMPAFFTASLVIAVILLTASIPTFGLIAVIIFPAGIIFYDTLGLTSYFFTNKKKYYIDNGETVYVPPITKF